MGRSKKALQHIRSNPHGKNKTLKPFQK